MVLCFVTVFDDVGLDCLVTLLEALVYAPAVVGLRCFGCLCVLLLIAVVVVFSVWIG